ncbi:HTH-type transcriptional repressor CzrA [Bacillus sp. THAF10]|uniref:ArsR/SmtB family transcription factor n=1 Tax=Bacillus sp. THAF10 TaxID=2587848 RepID=UPI0012697248|nr:metalloregulator ArsR/SmtB family transcription factor [Bacillus sp. THAF10]QFT91134.1 HTH-type transcriptional repressor CzrA [Bacillus sp. THAF10]
MNDVQSFLKALASEKRQEIMFLFKEKSRLTVNEIAELVGIGQSTASEHLAVLKRAGILLSKKEGKEVYYYPDKEQIIKSLQGFTEFITTCCE